MAPSELGTVMVYGEGDSFTGASSLPCDDNSVLIPDPSESQVAYISRPVPTSLATGGSLDLTPVAARMDALEVHWKITNPDINDSIRLYVHDRLHDENYLQTVPTLGKAEGRHVFAGLVRGHYDVRFFRGASAAHAADVLVAVCCLGDVVPLKVAVGHAPQRLLTVRVPSAAVEGPSDWLALFPAGEHSNREHRCAVSMLASQATRESDGADMVFNLKMPRKPGKYELRYFFGNSQSLQNGNAFSGRVPVVVPCEDVLTATFEVDIQRCTIAWKVYSVEPNKWQWIGVYDSCGQRLAFEYVCNHIYTTSTKEEGIIMLKNNPHELQVWAETGVMPSAIRGWRLRFYNTYFSEIVTEPVIDVPFLQ